MQNNDSNEILIIDDDADIRLTISILLTKEGYNVIETANGNEGIKKLTPSTKLVILDVMMPGKNGYEICQEIRSFSTVPILFLTAKTTENDMLMGFNLGGDDYLVKPFSFPELSARIHAILRRCEGNHALNTNSSRKEDWIIYEKLKVNKNTNQVLIDDKSVNLTETELPA